MGVKGLMSLIERDLKERVMKRVSLRDMASEWRAVQGSEEAVLVVDAMSIIFQLYGDTNWICGGEWREFEEKLLRFVGAFEAIGIKLVFIFDGPVVEAAKWSEWRSRRIEIIHKNHVLLRALWSDSLKGKGPPSGRIPGGAPEFARMVLKRTPHCEVYQSLGEADKEVAEYAKALPSCFGILTSDTDFLMFESKPYLSGRHLNQGTMETALFDREALAAALSLTFKQLPLFSCLMGNDIVSRKHLLPFHDFINRKERKRDKAVTVESIARAVKEYNWVGNCEDEEEVKKISKMVFESQKDWTVLLNGLKAYKLEAESSTLVKILLKKEEEVPFKPFVALDADLLSHLFLRHIRGEMNSTVITSLFISMEHYIIESLEDDMSPSFEHSSVIFRQVYRRAYEVLFKHLILNEFDLVVKEWVSCTDNDLKEPLLVPIESVLGEDVPTLRELWLDSSEDRNQIKFDLFLKCLGIETNWKESLIKVDADNVLLCCLLKYLLIQSEDLVILEEWEVDAIVAQAALLSSKTVDDLKALIPALPLDPKAIQIGSILMKGWGYLAFALEVCGNPLKDNTINTANSFCGKLFHEKYVSAKSGDKSVSELCEQHVRAIELFKQIKESLGFAPLLEEAVLG